MPFLSPGGSRVGFVMIISAAGTQPTRTFYTKDRADVISIVIASERAEQGVVISCIELVIVVIGTAWFVGQSYRAIRFTFPVIVLILFWLIAAVF
jgi:hypothetical protein